MQMKDRKDQADQSLNAVLVQMNCDSYTRREILDQGKSLLLVDFRNCDDLGIRSDSKEKARFSAERLTLAIFDNEFDEVRYIFWSKTAKIDSISFDPNKDLFLK
jgi:hypothetical protein